MIYPIVKFGDPVLEKHAEPVTAFDDDLKKLVEDMFESMYAAHGVGLAAPQIGISRRLAVIDITFKEDPEAKLVLVNPEIVHMEGRHTQTEGCLSIPEFRESVTRPRAVTVRAQDVNGKFFEKAAEERLAGTDDRVSRIILPDQSHAKESPRKYNSAFSTSHGPRAG